MSVAVIDRRTNAVVLYDLGAVRIQHGRVTDASTCPEIVARWVAEHTEHHEGEDPWTDPRWLR